MDPREAIRSRLSIKDVVGRYVELKPAGRGRWKGLCPFHKEKTPSFYVDEEKGLFYCFGCKAGGDVFSFVERIEGLTFAEALEKLAAEAGVELEKKPRVKKDKTLYDVNALSLEFFQKALDQTPEARAYLTGRGLGLAEIERFKLGYAPEGWDRLTRFLAEKGVPLEKGLAAGVLAEKEGRYYDRFRGRVMVPILDAVGRVAGFSGRALKKDQEPKYLNTPETSIFKKRELLFGLYQARDALREKKRAIIVEGLFDVVALHKMGYPETVAVLGSAFTPEQGLLLKRYGVGTLYLAFDADEAGRKATLKSLDQELAKSFLIYAVRLPEGLDPGDLLLRPDGRDLFERALSEALFEVEFRFEEAARGHDLSRPEGKRAVLEALLPRLVDAEPFDPVAEALKALIIERLGLRPEALEELIATRRKRARKKPLSTEEVTAASAEKALAERVLLLELDIVALLLSLKPEALARWAPYVEDHTWPPEGSFLAEFFRVARETNYDPAKIQHHFAEKGEGGALVERLMLAPSVPEAEFERTLKKAMARLREGYFREKLERLKARLKTEADPRLLKEIHELQQAIEAERRLYRAET